MNASLSRWVWLPTAAISCSVYATTYLTIEQAQQAIFPGAHLATAFVTLSEAQQRAIAQHSGVAVTDPTLKVWAVVGGGWFLVDQVVGKHELITYAVGLDAQGHIQQLEILDYRENYGYEIRTPAWRRQFVGKASDDVPALDRDIGTISGATLSCRHLTDGIKRLLASYDIVLKAAK